MSEASARDTIGRMQGAFMPENAEGVNKTIQFVLTGDDGGTWTAGIADGTCTVKEEPTEDASVTITMTPENFVKLVTGKLQPAMAFMTGKLKIKGDMMLAQKLGKFFDLKSLSA